MTNGRHRLTGGHRLAHQIDHGVPHAHFVGRVTAGPCTLEFFHNTPSGEEQHVCSIKPGEFRHFLSRRKTLPPLPIQWVICSGRPDAGIDGLGFPSDPSISGKTLMKSMRCRWQ